VKFFFSTENNSLYAKEEGYVIPLEETDNAGVSRRGATLFLVEKTIDNTNKKSKMASSSKDSSHAGNESKDDTKQEEQPEPVEKPVISTHKKTGEKITSSISNPEFVVLQKELFEKICELIQVQLDTVIAPFRSGLDSKSANDRGEQPLQEYIRQNFYVFPVLSDLLITDLLRVCLRSFLLHPMETTFTFVLPVWKQSVWWHLVSKYFSVVKVIKAGDDGFIHQRKDGTSINKTYQWPMVILHLSRSTRIKLDDWLVAHCRFNHTSGSVLNKLFTSGTNTGLKFHNPASFVLCHVCNRCKATRPDFKNLDAAERSSLHGPLREMYMDIHGPINPSSVMGFRYVLGFICSKTGFAFIYFLIRKSESLDCFRKLIVSLEGNRKLTGDKRFDPSKLTLVSDNAKEFISDDFDKYCASKQINRVFTSTYAHYQALFIERLWRTLAGASRTALTTANLSVIC